MTHDSSAISVSGEKVKTDNTLCVQCTTHTYKRENHLFLFLCPLPSTHTHGKMCMQERFGEKKERENESPNG
jgi:hypothetical protein